MRIQEAVNTRRELLRNKVPEERKKYGEAEGANKSSRKIKIMREKEREMKRLPTLHTVTS
jgi:hypothetical protein